MMLRTIPSSTDKYSAVYITDLNGVCEYRFLYEGLIDQVIDILIDIAVEDGKPLIDRFHGTAYG
ncbi:hypothetical protein [Rossellomorea arthrocnemi]|uniref:hypothetical protein n=1 Tax=Rossellomorea arthrocnemi TaxID=2769542 RepID=UPI00191B5B84|nr:hypothetical protein [Rossellomorea arthrocnemi]